MLGFFLRIELSMLQSFNTNHAIQLLCIVAAALIALVVYFRSRLKPIYLVDFACMKPPARFRMPSSTLMEYMSLVNPDEQTVQFQKKILERSGLGEETCFARLFLPPSTAVVDSRTESEVLMFTAIDDLIVKTNLDPKDVDILIVNSAVFAPTPSLCAMVVEKYKLRDDVRSFNLSGMGCSAGLVSIDLASRLLQLHPDCNALVVSADALGMMYYPGNDKAMMIPNSYFRMGSAALWLTNRASGSRRAKYQLLHVVRTNKSANDDAYRCVFQDDDDDGHVGISTSRGIVSVVGDAFKFNLTKLGPLVLPPSEKLQFLFNLIGRKLINAKWKPYVPSFKQAFEHFCIHVGGGAVINEVQRRLQLSEEDVEPARMTLHRFGNTSSSSIWYELSYIESKGRMKEGDRTWQISFGSGFKCNSAVWKCLRSVDEPGVGPWADCIHRYPVELGDVVSGKFV